jgi:outer membrane lipoprotein SlyB
MKLQTFIVPLLTAAALASSCATTDTRYGSNDTRYSYVHSNENMYAVIDAIETVRRGNDDNPVVGTKREDMYRIRVRFDDRSYRTVAQDSLDGLRVGSSVRIEGDRVRRY